MRIRSTRIPWRAMQAALFLIAALLSNSSAHANAFTAFGPKTYVSQGRPSGVITDTFAVADPATHYSLRVMASASGNRGDDSLAAASVTINGSEVVDPSQFSERSRVIQVAVSLHASNKIGVQVSGPAGSSVTVELIGGMTEAVSVLAPKVFQADANDSFAAAGSSLHYLLRITNSKITSWDRTPNVSSASVSVNGVAVVIPQQFGSIVSTLEIPVSLESANRLTVDFQGRPTGQITVEILGGVSGAFDAFGPKAYTLQNSFPHIFEDSFLVADITEPYVLVVRNSSSSGDFGGAGDPGDFDGNHPADVSTGNVWVNGVQLVDDDDFGGTWSQLVVPVVPNSTNQIKVEVKGRRGSSITAEVLGVNTNTAQVSIKATSTPPPNVNGWNNTDVTVTFTCANTNSACPSPQQIATEGANQIVQGTVLDNAGHPVTASVSLNIDKTPPVAAVSPAPLPNAAGWNNTNVTASFACQDALSGVATCPAPVMLTSEGANQIVSGTVTDLAGNTATVAFTANIDKTPPVVAASSSPSPNAGGWNNSDVTVSFSCSDSLSGISSCPQAKTVTAEGQNQTISAVALDIAGNTATTGTTVSIDKSAPMVTGVASPSANANGWNNTPVTVTFTCSDSISGVANCPSPEVIPSEGAAQQVTAAAVDNAGNSGSASLSLNIDLTPPTLTILSPPNGQAIAASTPSITVSGTQTDNLSGLASVSCNGLPASTKGAAFTCTAVLGSGTNSVSVQASDLAGNVTNSLLTLNYVPAPQVTITAPGNLTVTNVSPVTVSGTVNDPAATVTINGVAALQGSGGFSIPVPLVEGLNTLVAVATSSAGVTGTATVQVTLDTTPPHITIDSPADGITTTESSIAVSGLANDVVVGTVNSTDVHVTVNGIPAQVSNRNFSVASVPLTIGQNTIQASGLDRAGNGTTTSITVKRLAPGQVPTPAIGAAVINESLSILSGNNQTGAIGAQLAAPLAVLLTDSTNRPVPNQTVVFKVTGNNGTLIAEASSAPATAVAVTTDSAGKAQALWTLGQRAGAGINAVQVSSALAVGPVNFSATGLTGDAVQIVVDSGNGQTGAIGQALPFPFVAVVVDSGHNRVPNVPVTFTASGGGGTLVPATTLTVCSGSAAGSSSTCGASSGPGAPTQTVTTDSDGRAIVVLTLGLEEGIANNLVVATIPAAPDESIAFSATAMAPGDPANTTISGVVLDNSSIPIPGVTMRLFQTNQGSANNLPVPIGTPLMTDAQGTFHIPSAPVGSFKLMADGTTATLAQKYPTLEYDIVTVAGNDNTLGMPIYLPALDTVNQLCVDSTHGGTLTLPQVPGFALAVQPGAAMFPGGSRTGCISVTPVNGDKVPMTPGFGQQPRFIVTIQPVGTSFNPPAAITLPNVDGLDPQSVTEMYSYDHDLGMFVAIGTGTVSADGSVITSDAGVGVLKAGWHCGGNPTPGGHVGSCGDCQSCNGTQCVANDANKPAAKCSSCMNGVPIPPLTQEACCALTRPANDPTLGPAGGWVGCCQGDKVVCVDESLLLPPGDPLHDLDIACAKAHEMSHVPDTPACADDCTFMGEGSDDPGTECRAYTAQVSCLQDGRASACGDNADCNMELDERIQGYEQIANKVDPHGSCFLAPPQ